MCLQCWKVKAKLGDLRGNLTTLSAVKQRIEKMPSPQTPGHFQHLKSPCCTRYMVPEGAVWKGQSAGHGSGFGKPKALGSPWEHPGCLCCLLIPGELRVPALPTLWDLSCVLWQLPQHLPGVLLMGFTWVEEKKDHSREMAALPDLCEFPCAFMAAHKMDHLSLRRWAGNQQLS